MVKRLINVHSLLNESVNLLFERNEKPFTTNNNVFTLFEDKSDVIRMLLDF